MDSLINPVSQTTFFQHGTHTTVGTLSIKVSLFEYRGDGFQFDSTRILAAGALVDRVLTKHRPTTHGGKSQQLPLKGVPGKICTKPPTGIGFTPTLATEALVDTP